MKKSVLYFAALICMMMQSVNMSANDKVSKKGELPVAATRFIQQNFPEQQIITSKYDSNFGKKKKSYEVVLSKGVELKFNKKGKCGQVDCNYNAVPTGLVPAHISEFVKTNFPGTQIVKIDKTRRGFVVELSNEFNLTFSHKGKFKDIE